MAKKRELARLDSVPLTERARSEILAAISSGQFVDRLPPEDELASILGVSRTTVRAALQSLEENGVVRRRRAIGTTINKHVIPSRLALGRLVGFDQLVGERGEVEVDQKWDELETPPEIFAESFDQAAVGELLNATGGFVVTNKSFIGSGTEAIHASDLIPTSRIVRQPRVPVPPSSLFELSRMYMDVPIDHAIAEIAPMVVRDDKTTKLNLEPGTAFVRLHQRSYSSNGELLALSITDANDRHVRYEIFRR